MFQIKLLCIFDIIIFTWSKPKIRNKHFVTSFLSPLNFRQQEAFGD